MPLKVHCDMPLEIHDDFSACLFLVCNLWPLQVYLMRGICRALIYMHSRRITIITIVTIIIAITISMTTITITIITNNITTSITIITTTSGGPASCTAT